MKTLIVLFLSVFTSCLTSCKEKVNSTGGVTPESNTPVPVIPEKKRTFERVVFTQALSHRTITLVSETECEIDNKDGQIVLAEYSRESSKLRFVFRVAGTATVKYADLDTYGLTFTALLASKDDPQAYMQSGINATYWSSSELIKFEAVLAESQEKGRRMLAEYPALLVGVWNEVCKSNEKASPVFRHFKNDKTWQLFDENKKLIDEGFWEIEDGIRLSMETKGRTFRLNETYQCKIVELTKEKYLFSLHELHILGEGEKEHPPKDYFIGSRSGG